MNYNNSDISFCKWLNALISEKTVESYDIVKDSKGK